MIPEITFYNNSLEQWLISACILVVALLLNLFISYINRKYLRALAEKTRNYFDNILVSTLETPMKVAIILVAIWIAFNRLHLSPAFEEWLYKTYKILTVLNITWFIAHMINGVLKEFFIQRNAVNLENNKDIHYNKHLITIILKVISFVVWTIGSVTALNNAGLQLTAILGTLGIGGIAIALASQDTVKNVFGGFTVLLDGTFRIGDRVKIGEFEGEVEDIGIRSTKIRNNNKQLITIPNFKIVEGPIVNTSAVTRIYVNDKVELSGKATPDQIEEALTIIKECIAENKAVLKNKTTVTLVTIGQASHKIETTYYILSQLSKKSDVISTINLDILRKLQNAGIELK